MEHYTAHNEAELASVIHREAGVPLSLADEFAARASCGEIVQFTVRTNVSVPQRHDSDYTLSEVATVWQASADDTWDLQQVEA